MVLGPSSKDVINTFSKQEPLMIHADSKIVYHCMLEYVRSVHDFGTWNEFYQKLDKIHVPIILQRIKEAKMRYAASGSSSF